MSTKKGEHGTISTRKTATSLSKRSLQETEKIKTKKKSSDLDLVDKNKLKNISSNNIKLNKENESNKKSSSQQLKSRVEVPNTSSSKKNPASISTTKNIPNRIVSKEIIDKKDKTSMNPSNTKKSHTTANRNTKSIPRKTSVNLPKTSTTQNMITQSKNKETLAQFKKTIIEPERPRTATLEKSTVININKFGPDSSKPKSPTSKSDSSEEQDQYEDDFESYESDFEQYSSSSSTNSNSVSVNSNSLSSSSEELIYFEGKISTNIMTLSNGNDDEKNLDSGHFEMPGYKHIPMLDNIKETIEKENNTLVSSNNYASLSDEGFEDHKSIPFVNFLDAHIKNKRRRSNQLKQKRGEEILSMVRFNCSNFTLIDLAPVSYEQYVRKFGASNSIQTSSQTGEDDVDEEIQTEEISFADKWAQQPVVFSHSYEKSDSDILGMDAVQKRINQNSLDKFLLSAGEVILRIQVETKVEEYTGSTGRYFSESIADLKTDSSSFLGTQVTEVLFPSDISNEVITIHLKQEGSLLAIWNISNYETPELLISCYGVITSCCFGIINYELIFTGLEDGTILVWNGRRETNSTDLVACVPLFSTGISSEHQSKIIGLHFLRDSSIKQWNIQQTNELCSIDEEGQIILWTIVLKYFGDVKYYNKNELTLIKNETISLCNLCPDLIDLHCTGFCSSNLNPYFLFISTNYGPVIHYIIKGGIKKIKQFSSETQLLPKCLECCPFSPDYFLAGYENGDISLFSISSERPLITLSEKDKAQNSAIEAIQWSKNKSTIIYSKDDKNIINIWDLNESDMFPIHSIIYKENISCMKMSPINENLRSKESFLLIGTNKGNLHLHRLNEGHGESEDESIKYSMETFFKYVKRL